MLLIFHLAITIAGIRFTIIREIPTRETTKREIAGMIGMTDATGMIFAATTRQTIAPLVTYRGGIGEVIASVCGPPTIAWRGASLQLIHRCQPCRAGFRAAHIAFSESLVKIRRVHEKLGGRISHAGRREQARANLVCRWITTCGTREF